MFRTHAPAAAVEKGQNSTVNQNGWSVNLFISSASALGRSKKGILISGFDLQNVAEDKKSLFSGY